MSVCSNSVVRSILHCFATAWVSLALAFALRSLCTLAVARRGLGLSGIPGLMSLFSERVLIWEGGGGAGGGRFPRGMALRCRRGARCA